jgi:molybdopterin converting factor small subunit
VADPFTAGPVITVHVPALLRDLTGNRQLVQLPATGTVTVRELLRSLDAAYPGFSDRLLYQDDLLPGIAVFVNGEQGLMKLQEKVPPAAVVHFVPPIVGG